MSEPAHNPGMTDYLAAALCRVLADIGQATANELLAQMDDHYSGKTTLAEVQRELDLLESAESVESFMDDGERWYVDA